MAWKNLVALTTTVLCFGCNCPPRNIGEYRINENASHVLQTYTANVLKGDFEEAAGHVFGIVDQNKDHVIDHEEAYAAIQIIIPHTKNFRESVLAIKPPAESTDDSEVAQKVE
ncbi:MAG: hypothetical protein KJ600_01260 [Nanoarchaeota archaeon]|nr:hypothetical protein [Nanoarchaeota archaeon]MBU1103171.1 hypothetical protein [Nanoarchaeota archaeon]